MDFNFTLNIFTLGCGAYCLYTFLKLLTGRKLFKNALLIPKEREVEDCTDEEGYISYLLPRMVQDFAGRCPDVHLEIKEMITPQIVRAMEHDEIDAAILAGGTCPEGITEDCIFDDRFYAYLSPGHRLFERSNIRLEDLDLKEMLLLSEGHCFRDQILDLCPSKGGAHASYYFESGSLETLMRIVDNTEFMTIIPEMAVPYVPQEHAAQVKPLAKGAVSRKIAVAVRRTYVKDSIVKVLKESVAAVGGAVGE